MRPMRALHRSLVPLILLILLTGCRPDGNPAGAANPPTASPDPVAAAPSPPPASPLPATPTVVPPSPSPLRPSPSPTPVPPTATTAPTATPPPTAPPAPTATPDPFAGLSIPSLRQLTFQQAGRIERVGVLEELPAFTRYRIRYPSDGIAIDGFMNVPRGEGPFPVVIVNHGYMPPDSYVVTTYTTRYADDLAAAGFIAIHPSFRNHRGSERGENPFRIGYARDVLALIPLAQALPESNGGKVGMWGHSMGGGITLRVLTLTDQVAAAVLYGSMSGDEAKNYEAIMVWSGGEAGRDGSLPEPPTNGPLYAAISPINFLDLIVTPIEIHHGVLDDQVPVDWSRELAAGLNAAGVPHTLYEYPGQNHILAGADDRLFQQRVVDFFRAHLGR